MFIQLKNLPQSYLLFGYALCLTSLLIDFPDLTNVGLGFLISSSAESYVWWALIISFLNILFFNKNFFFCYLYLVAPSIVGSFNPNAVDLWAAPLHVLAVILLWLTLILLVSTRSHNSTNSQALTLP
jgi:hypothetical protein